MPDYAQQREDEREREERHYHAAAAYKAGWDAYKAGQSGAGFLPSSDHVRGWMAARNEERDNAITATRHQTRELDGDILFA